MKLTKLVTIQGTKEDVPETFDMIASIPRAKVEDYPRRKKKKFSYVGNSKKG